MAMLINNYDRSKVFVWDNRFRMVPYTNTTGGTVTLLKGRLIGKITTSQKAWPQVSTATDGSQQPLFVLADDYEVAAGATVNLHVCEGGDVVASKLIFAASETLATVITDDVSIGDALRRNSTIILVDGDQLTKYDNQ